MRIFNKFKGTRGFVSTYNHILKLRDMDNTAIRKSKIINHAHKYGIESAIDAFGVGRSTIFLWKKKLKQSHGHLNVLNNKSRTPINKRKRIIDEKLEFEIIRLREKIPCIGKTQIYNQIKHYIKTSESTVGRVLKYLKEKGRVNIRGQKPKKVSRNKVKRLRREKKDGFEIDAVVRHVCGIKWYFVNAINLRDRNGFSYLTLSHSSIESSKIFEQINIDCKQVQTDNGSEFLDHFHNHCIKNNIEHFFTYPRSPKMNAFVERFNRTLQDEFIKWNMQTMSNRGNLELMRKRLSEYMDYYNNTRPHSSLSFLSPISYANM